VCRVGEALTTPPHFPRGRGINSGIVLQTCTDRAEVVISGTPLARHCTALRFRKRLVYSPSLTRFSFACRQQGAGGAALRGDGGEAGRRGDPVAAQPAGQGPPPAHLRRRVQGVVPAGGAARPRGIRLTPTQGESVSLATDSPPEGANSPLNLHPWSQLLANRRGCSLRG
jgi:hypothetical protein